MKISVAGLGIISKIGGTHEIEDFLSRDGTGAASLPDARHLGLDFPEDYGVSEKLVRRMSHFARLSLLSASHALRDSGLDTAGKSIGIIQGSVYGPIISGIQAFDDLIDFGDNQLSPTNFSGSVFNTSATYLSLAFGIQGRTLTHTSGQDTLYNSLLTAGQWLESGDAGTVILGIGDEYSSYFDNSLSDKQSLLPTSEGWTTFILNREEKTKYGSIEFGRLEKPEESKSGNIIYSAWHENIKADGLLPGDNRPCFPVHLRGSYPGAAAFDLALALLCAKSGKFLVNNDSGKNYKIQTLDSGGRITCYQLAETGGIFYYNIDKE